MGSGCWCHGDSAVCGPSVRPEPLSCGAGPLHEVLSPEGKTQCTSPWLPDIARFPERDPEQSSHAGERTLFAFWGAVSGCGSRL